MPPVTDAALPWDRELDDPGGRARRRARCVRRHVRGRRARPPARCSCSHPRACAASTHSPEADGEQGRRRLDDAAPQAARRAVRRSAHDAARAVRARRRAQLPHASSTPPSTSRSRSWATTGAVDVFAFTRRLGPPHGARRRGPVRRPCDGTALRRAGRRARRARRVGRVRAPGGDGRGGRVGQAGRARRDGAGRGARDRDRARPRRAARPTRAPTICSRA